jgi:hypothetical protein
MPIIRAQVILKTVDQVPENFVTNSFAFEVPTPATGAPLITPILKNFYDNLVGYLSPVIAQNAHSVKYSLLPGTPPNYPFLESTFNLVAAPAGSALPDEIAVCMSFQGTRGAGFPQARRRGRIFFGPLDSTAATGNRPAGAFTAALANQGNNIDFAVAALGAGYGWGVWSPTDGSFTPVVNGWVDNAFDVQRRRGVRPTGRNVFPP